MVESLTVDSWRGREARYRFRGGLCGSCRRIFYPPMSSCPYCGARSVEEVDLPRKGRLVAYTMLYSVEEGSRRGSPVAVGLIDLGVARIVAELTDVELGGLKPGAPVEAVFRRLTEEGGEGVIVYGVKFRPASEG